jgi:hypothetical protein
MISKNDNEETLNSIKPSDIVACRTSVNGQKSGRDARVKDYTKWSGAKLAEPVKPILEFGSINKQAEVIKVSVATDYCNVICTSTDRALYDKLKAELPAEQFSRINFVNIQN